MLYLGPWRDIAATLDSDKHVRSLEEIQTSDKKEEREREGVVCPLPVYAFYFNSARVRNPRGIAVTGKKRGQEGTRQGLGSHLDRRRTMLIQVIVIIIVDGQFRFRKQRRDLTLYSDRCKHVRLTILLE